MFRNRLVKVYRHLGKQARKAGISCYRVYDHDLPEFPFVIEFYGDALYVAEYRRNHGMEESDYEAWMETSLEVMSEVLSVPKEKIFLKLRQRKPGRLGQYQKQDQQRREFEVAPTLSRTSPAQQNSSPAYSNQPKFVSSGPFSIIHKNGRRTYLASTLTKTETVTCDSVSRRTRRTSSLSALFIELSMVTTFFAN